jgi:hypothetical protein
MSGAEHYLRLPIPGLPTQLNGAPSPPPALCVFRTKSTDPVASPSACWTGSNPTLRWDPWYQGTRAPEPWALVPGHFFILFYFLFWREFFFHTKNKKKYCFLSVFSLFHSLFLSFSVHTLSVLLSLVNFTNVSCEGQLKKGVAYKL